MVVELASRQCWMEEAKRCLRGAFTCQSFARPEVPRFAQDDGFGHLSRLVAQLARRNYSALSTQHSALVPRYTNPFALRIIHSAVIRPTKTAKKPQCVHWVYLSF